MADTGPILAHSAESALTRAPAARSRSDPIASAVVSGRSRRSSVKSSDAWRSPDASPALKKMSALTGGGRPSVR